MIFPPTINIKNRPDVFQAGFLVIEGLVRLLAVDDKLRLAV